MRSWAAWSPGIEDRDAWRAWCEEPKELAREGRPAANFLPPLLRRRCSGLARIMLSAAFDCCEPEVRAQVATVFASRHGNINESIELLERLARGQALSPTRFSHSVHNAQAGLYSIAADNRQASSSIAAQEDTFGSGWIEALTLLARDPRRPVLLVVGDVPLAATFAALVDEPETSYALALLLEADAPGVGVRIALEHGAPQARRPRWPDALEFLRWFLSDAPRLSLACGRRRWVWERTA
ncbi:MAG: beta-ketoacyl synthase chain length factor [Myxococcales bacterium]|nr:beta-ketoacyl synthase chain length factor [Myxococcales bacterium]